ncbi:MAG TPA: hypothetical protein VIY28_01445 [Pseudonocardiaceae bacterium]
MRAHFLGKDPESIEGESPTLFATNRTDRVTYIAQGWKVTDPQVLADVGPGSRPRDLGRDPGRRAQDVRPSLPGPGGRALSLLIGDDFSELFRTFEHTAFRLEVRESYNAPREVESFRRFKAGEPVDLSWAETWFSMIRQATAEGRRFARVRVW